MSTPDPKPLLTANHIAGVPEVNIRHPWNPSSDVYLKQLSEMAGLSRIVVTLARVPPGKESFVYHSHERDEEFLFIISGRGRAEIGENTFEVGPGDFMGFTAPGVAHHLVNPYSEDLVYLMGGERSGFDVGYFPKLKRRIVFSKTGIHAVEDSSLKSMSFDDFIAKP
jgi:uncharacterized cupin superfamily protein